MKCAKPLKCNDSRHSRASPRTISGGGEVVEFCFFNVSAVKSQGQSGVNSISGRVFFIILLFTLEMFLVVVLFLS